MGVQIVEILGAANRGGMYGLGELTVYPAVGLLQTKLNTAKLMYAEWTPGADIGDDGKYGRTTHARLRSFIRYATRHVPVWSACAGIGTDELDRSGPGMVGGCIRHGLFGMSDADLNVIQQAWREWKDAGSTAENERPVPTSPPSADGTPGPAPPADTGLSTGAWLLIGGGILASLALIAWLIWGDDK